VTQVLVEASLNFPFEHSVTHYPDFIELFCAKKGEGHAPTQLPLLKAKVPDEQFFTQVFET